MIRFAVKPLIFAFCLSMAVGTSLLMPPETGEAARSMIPERQEDGAVSTISREKDLPTISHEDEKEDDRKKMKIGNAQSWDEVQEDRVDKTKKVTDIEDENVSEEENLSNHDKKVQQEIEGMKQDIEETKKKTEDDIQTLFMIVTVMGILLLVCFTGLIHLLNSMKSTRSKVSSKDLEDIKGKLSKMEMVFEKVVEDNKTNASDVAERVKKLEKAVNMLLKEKSPQPRSTDKTNEEAEKERIQTYRRAGTGTGINERSFGGSSSAQGRLKEIVDAFNEMRVSAKAAGYGATSIKQEFVKKYQVVAFKCVNYEERLSNDNMPPRFAVVNSLPESTLWGVPLPDGTLAVLPSIAAYTSNIHEYGGMKELFISGYVSGSPQNILVKVPAIMTSNFSEIREVGVLSLT